MFFVVQATQTAIANAHYLPVERLARWLLMCQDRGDTAEFTMTHQFLSVMLALQSPGVVEALSVWEDNNIISATKGKVMVLDRPGLEAIVRGAYGLPEQEYSRLIAPFP